MRAVNDLALQFAQGQGPKTISELMLGLASQLTSTNPHVVLVGHITGHELREKSSENDAANGLLNRFLMLHVHRPKLVALPEPTPQEVLDSLMIK